MVYYERALHDYFIPCQNKIVANAITAIYARRMMARLDAIPWNVQHISCVLIGLFFMVWYKHWTCLCCSFMSLLYIRIQQKFFFVIADIVFFSFSMNSPDMLAAEMPKRRPSFRTQLSRSSRISDSFSDRDQLLANTSEEIEDGKTVEPQLRFIYWLVSSFLSWETCRTHGIIELLPMISFV